MQFIGTGEETGAKHSIWKRNVHISTTTQKVNVLLLNDWCARNWGLEAAEWDNAKVFETSFSSSHMVGGISEANATGTLNLGEVIAAAQTIYPDLAGHGLWMGRTGAEWKYRSVTVCVSEDQ